MYMMPSMIEWGLKPNQSWPSETHRTVASNVALCNPNVRTRDRLTEICQKIIAIPTDRIESVTLEQLVEEFEVPV